MTLYWFMSKQQIEVLLYKFDNKKIIKKQKYNFTESNIFYEKIGYVWQCYLIITCIINLFDFYDYYPKNHIKDDL